MKNLLYEILTEELPARFIKQSLHSLKALAEKYLHDFRLKYNDIKTLGTPRRLTLFIEGLSEKQLDLEEEVLGPSAKVAFDPKGNLTQAALGFANKYGVSAEELYLKETPRGAYLAVKIRKVGLKTEELLPLILPKITAEISFPKRMFWGEVRFPFARPIRSILCLYGDTPIDIAVAGLKSKNYTFGHRYLAVEPIKLSLADLFEYKTKLLENWVVVDPEERKRITKRTVREVAEPFGIPDIEEDLLEENANLVEYPFPILASFDEKFLRMPEELTKTALQEHQRYFLIRNSAGRLINYFVAVNNNKVFNQEVLKKGHERVAKARLEDAIFYYERDLKQSMDSWVAALKGIVFHIRCGSLYDKTERLCRLTKWLKDALCLPVADEALERACLYSKADLASEVVKEFPSLQGVMGSYYYRYHFGDPVEAQAIAEQYLPQPNRDELPKTDLGLLLSLCDKIDHISALIGVNEKPTGESDPYGLRRAALGVIKILIGREVDLELNALLEIAYGLLKAQGFLKRENAYEESADFIRRRLESEFLSLSYAKSLINAVIVRPLNPYDQLLRLKALASEISKPEFEGLLTSFKRVYAMLKNQDLGSLPEVRPSLFESDVEINLYNLCQSLKEDYFSLLQEKKYAQALNLLYNLNPLVESFFDKVFVMVEDEKVRLNRLALLKEVSEMYKNYAHLEHLLA